MDGEDRSELNIFRGYYSEIFLKTFVVLWRWTMSPFGKPPSLKGMSGGKYGDIKTPYLMPNEDVGVREGSHVRRYVRRYVSIGGAHIHVDCSPPSFWSTGPTGRLPLPAGRLSPRRRQTLFVAAAPTADHPHPQKERER